MFKLSPKTLIAAFITAAMLLPPLAAADLSPAGTQTAESQGALTPDQALTLLKEGNERFVSGKMMDRDLSAQVKATAGGQYPQNFVQTGQNFAPGAAPTIPSATDPQSAAASAMARNTSTE